VVVWTPGHRMYFWRTGCQEWQLQPCVTSSKAHSFCHHLARPSVEPGRSSSSVESPIESLRKTTCATMCMWLLGMLYRSIWWRVVPVVCRPRMPSCPRRELLPSDPDPISIRRVAIRPVLSRSMIGTLMHAAGDEPSTHTVCSAASPVSLSPVRSQSSPPACCRELFPIFFKKKEFLFRSELNKGETLCVDPLKRRPPVLCE
jgi:hypothetical protein